MKGREQPEKYDTYTSLALQSITGDTVPMELIDASVSNALNAGITMQEFSVKWIYYVYVVIHWVIGYHELHVPMQALFLLGNAYKCEFILGVILGY